MTMDSDSTTTYDIVRETNPTIADALDGEHARQNDTLSMIASENHVSEAIRRRTQASTPHSPDRSERASKRQ